MRINDLSALNQLWTEDGVYMLPGVPLMKGRDEIRSTVADVWNELHAMAAGDDILSGFDLVPLVDPVSGDKAELVTAVGSQSVTIGSRPPLRCEGSAVLQLIKGEWKLRVIAVVVVSDVLRDVIQKGK